MAVIDFTSSLTMGPDITSVNDKYCVLGAGDVVTVNFSGFITKTTDAHVATIFAVLVANISNIFFCGFEETPTKGAAGGRIDSSGNMIINNAVSGHAYWIGVTYVRRTA